MSCDAGREAGLSDERLPLRGAMQHTGGLRSPLSEERLTSPLSEERLPLFSGAVRSPLSGEQQRFPSGLRTPLSEERLPLLGSTSSLGPEEIERQYVSITREDYGLSGELDPTTLALERCNRTVLQPMRWVMCLLGWQPFGIMSSRFRMKRALNAAYIVFIYFLIVFQNLMDIVLCEYEAGFVVNMQCRMVIRNLIPGMVHMGAFTYAAYMFRYRQSGLDQIEGLIQTVFIRCKPQRYRTAQGDLSQDAVITMLRRFVAIACIWMILRTSSDVMKDAFVNDIIIPTSHTFPFGRELRRWRVPIAIFKCMGDLLCNVVHGVIVVTYCMYARLVMLYMDTVRNNVQNRSHPLNTVIQDVTMVARYNHALNRGLGVAVSFIVYLLLVDIINVFFDMTDGTRSYYWNRITQFMNMVAFLLLLCTSLKHAANYSSKCRGLSHLANIVQKGYRDATPRELDSFALFICNVKLHAEILGIPVTTSLVSGIGFVTLLLLLVLGQLGWLAIHWTSIIVPIHPDL